MNKGITFIFFSAEIAVLLLSFGSFFIDNAALFPSRNIICLLFYCILFHLFYFHLFFKVLPKSIPAFKVSYGIVLLGLFGVAVELADIFPNSWDPYDGTQKNIAGENPFSVSYYLNYPFSEYHKSTEYQEFPTYDSSLEPTKFLLILDKTGSTISNSTISTNISRQGVDSVNSRIGSGENIISPDLSLDDRDNLVISTIFKLYRTHKDGFEFQCYLYYGDKFIHPLYTDGSDNKFATINRDNISDILRSFGERLSGLNKEYYDSKGINKTGKTNFDFLFSWLNNRDFGDQEEKSVVLSVISDFDDESQSIDPASDVERSISGFLSANSFQNNSLLILNGIPTSGDNQKRIISMFGKYMSNQNARIVHESKCLSEGNFENYYCALREVKAAGDLEFIYPRQDKDGISIGLFKCKFLANMQCSLYMSDLNWTDASTYMLLSNSNTRYIFNNFYPLTFEENRNYEFKMYKNGDNMDSEKFIFISPSGSSYTYRHKIVFKNDHTLMSLMAFIVIYNFILVATMYNTLLVFSIALSKILNRGYYAYVTTSNSKRYNYMLLAGYCIVSVMIIVDLFGAVLRQIDKPLVFLISTLSLVIMVAFVHKYVVSSLPESES